MSTEVIIGIILFIVGIGASIIFFIKNSGIRSNKSFMMQSRNINNPIKRNMYEDNDFIVIERNKNGNLTLKQKIIYAGWHISPIIFNTIRGIVSVIFFLITKQFFSLFLSTIMAVVGFVIVTTILNKAMEKRSNAFDKDFASYLQSIVSLLKAGMNVTTAMEEGGGNLEEGSTVKKEVESLSSRLKSGVGEDEAIGRFANTIDYPEVELFVQAVILGNKLGGSLTQTLDRISEQCRKKQYFRESAVAAVGQSKGSLWIIMIILVGVLAFLSIKAPQMTDHLKTDTGKIILEAAIFLNLFAIYLMGKIVKIKV